MGSIPSLLRNRQYPDHPLLKAACRFRSSRIELIPASGVDHEVFELQMDSAESESPGWAFFGDKIGDGHLCICWVDIRSIGKRIILMGARIVVAQNEILNPTPHHLNSTVRRIEGIG